jgi:hypothetical protein
VRPRRSRSGGAHSGSVFGGGGGGMHDGTEVCGALGWNHKRGAQVGCGAGGVHGSWSEPTTRKAFMGALRGTPLRRPTQSFSFL